MHIWKTCLPSCSKEMLSNWLYVFISVTRNQTGEPYSPKTLYTLLCGIFDHYVIDSLKNRFGKKYVRSVDSGQ